MSSISEIILTLSVFTEVHIQKVSFFNLIMCFTYFHTSEYLENIAKGEKILILWKFRLSVAVHVGKIYNNYK